MKPPTLLDLLGLGFGILEIALGGWERGRFADFILISLLLFGGLICLFVSVCVCVCGIFVGFSKQNPEPQHAQLEGPCEALNPTE